MSNEAPLLEVRNLTKHFPVGHGKEVHAVNGVSFTLEKGETLGIILLIYIHHIIVLIMKRIQQENVERLTFEAEEEACTLVGFSNVKLFY